MNDTETANVLGVLTAAWPDKDLPTATVELWRGMLRDLAYEDAQAAALAVVREDHWFPSIARFLQLTEAKAHGRRIRDAEHRGLGTGRRAVAPPGPLMDAARELLAEQKTKQHNHKGPAPCPVCGGRAAKAEAQPVEATYKKPDSYGTHTATSTGLAPMATYDDTYMEDF